MNDRVYNKGLDALRSPERLARLEIPRVVDLCMQNNDIASVLDIGTGSGVFAEAFGAHVAKVAGIDTNPEMIAKATEFVPGADFRLASAGELPFENKSFDLVFMGAVFHEVNDYQVAMDEAFRVAFKEVALLEWTYKEEQVGPPLNHRLQESFIFEVAGKAGFSKYESIPLNQLVLYKLYK